MSFKQVNLDRPIKKSLENAIEINLGNKLGISTDDSLIDFNNGLGYTQGVQSDVRIPMMAKVTFLPTIGDSKHGTESGYTDAINTYYTKLRSHNSSLSAYQPIDVFKFSLALCQLNILADVIKRKIRSFFLPGKFFSINFRRGIVAAQSQGSLDENLTQSSMANYITKFNQIVESAQDIVFPKQFALNNRYHKLLNCIYADDPEMDKSQMIIFVPYGIWRLSVLATDPMVGQFNLVRIDNLTLDQLIDLFKDMVNDLGNDSDYNNIMAEIKKAVETNCFKLDVIPTNPEPVEINYSLDVIDLVRNAKYVGGLAAPTDMYIYENNTGRYPYLTHYNANTTYSADPEYIYLSDSYNITDSSYSYKYFDTTGIKSAVHSHADAPDKYTAYNITAGFANIQSYPTNPYPHALDYVSELYMNFSIMEYDSALMTWTQFNYKSYLYGFFNQSLISKLHSFSCSPDIIMYGYDSSNLYNNWWIHSDIDNVTFVPNPTIAAVQSVALQCSLVYEDTSE